MSGRCAAVAGDISVTLISGAVGRDSEARMSVYGAVGRGASAEFGGRSQGRVVWQGAL